MKLFLHQEEVLKQTEHLNHVAYYLDMGLGKTFVGSEKMKQLGNRLNLLICQKSKIEDWVNHFTEHYPNWMIIDYPKMQRKVSIDDILNYSYHMTVVVIVNYELAWRRTDLHYLRRCCLMLDESSLIQNNKAKQTKFILSLDSREVILLSGTPCSGKYENLWSQSKLLGFGMTKTAFDSRFVNWELLNVGAKFVRIPDRKRPYKNVEELKNEFRRHGAVFLKTDECFELPSQTFQKIRVEKPKLYKTFLKDRVVELEDRTLIGDTTLGLRIGLREICGMYSAEKITAFDDLLSSTNDRLIVFYNFNEELSKLKKVAQSHHRPISEVNGSVKDLTAYENDDDSITFCQYQAGSMGLNLQKANKVVYYTLPERSDLFEQSKKRIHRIGQDKPCWYYILLTEGTLENGILSALERKEDYTDELFRKELKNEIQH